MSNLTHNWKGSPNFRGSQINYRCSENEKAVIDATVAKFNEIMQAKSYASRHQKYSNCDVITYVMEKYLHELETKDAKTIQDDYQGHGLINFHERLKNQSIHNGNTNL
jgi:hypothetical protein